MPSSARIVTPKECHPNTAVRRNYGRIFTPVGVMSNFSARAVIDESAQRVAQEHCAGWHPKHIERELDATFSHDALRAVHFTAHQSRRALPKRTHASSKPMEPMHPSGRIVSGKLAQPRSSQSRHRCQAELPQVQAASGVRMADTSNSRVTFSLTSTPPASRVAFQVTPQSLRFTVVLPSRPTRWFP
jgi:hypothetical protein